jgi:hypothetical protein
MSQNSCGNSRACALERAPGRCWHKRAFESLTGESYARTNGRHADESAEKGVEVMREADVKFNVADARLVSESRDELRSIETAWIKKAGEKGVDGAKALEFLRAEGASYRP